MFVYVETLKLALDNMGLDRHILDAKQVLVKINLARPPQPGHPRTDARMLADLIRYVSDCGGRLTLAEAADGFLDANVAAIGLDTLVTSHAVTLLDLDQADTEQVVIDDEVHHIPTCLRDFPLRIAFPMTSQRPGMIFSNNVKLFVGAVPRRLYQTGEPGAPRPRIHENLHQSVATLYRAICQFAPFHYFINGGNAFIEKRGEVTLPSVFVGDDGPELDRLLVVLYELEQPEYLALLKTHTTG